jgi:hypothetical protein
MLAGHEGKVGRSRPIRIRFAESDRESGMWQDVFDQCRFSAVDVLRLDEGLGRWLQ